MLSITKKSDDVGALASTLCLVHCLITPVLFIVQTCTSTCCSSAVIPSWWIGLDFLFLGISFLAILWSSKTTTKKWLKYALWVGWFLLLFVILNEKFEFISIHKYLGYVPALTLVFLHLYNRKHSTNKDVCCSLENK